MNENNPYKDVSEIIRATRTGEYKEHGNLEDADMIVVFDFGEDPLASKYGSDKNPLKDVNFYLASRAAEFYQTQGLPVFAQHESAKYLRDYFAIAAIELSGSDEVGEHLDTQEIATRLKVLCRNQNNPLVVAQAFHMARVDSILLGAGFDTVVSGDMPRVFDPESNQFWTKYKTLWALVGAVAVGRDVQRGSY